MKRLNNAGKENWELLSGSKRLTEGRRRGQISNRKVAPRIRSSKKKKKRTKTGEKKNKKKRKQKKKA
jgi:hypothetical protein